MANLCYCRPWLSLLTAKEIRLLRKVCMLWFNPRW